VAHPLVEETLFRGLLYPFPTLACAMVLNLNTYAAWTVFLFLGWCPGGLSSLWRSVPPAAFCWL